VIFAYVVYKCRKRCKCQCCLCWPSCV